MPEVAGSSVSPQELSPNRLEFKQVQLGAFGFVENIHVSSNACSPMQPHANTASVSDEKSQNVQAHAGLSKNLAGSLLDRAEAAGGDWRSMRPLLSVRQAAKFLGVCHATVYRLCVRGMLPHFRVSNAIRIDVADLMAFLGRAGRGHLP